MELRQWQRGFWPPSQKRTDRTHQHERMGPLMCGHDPVGRPPTAIASEDRLGRRQSARTRTRYTAANAAAGRHGVQSINLLRARLRWSYQAVLAALTSASSAARQRTAAPTLESASKALSVTTLAVRVTWSTYDLAGWYQLVEQTGQRH